MPYYPYIVVSIHELDVPPRSLAFRRDLHGDNYIQFVDNDM